MIEDSVLREVRAAREEYAKAHDFDVYKIVEDLRKLDLGGEWKVVRLPPRRPKAPGTSPGEPVQSLPQTEAGSGAAPILG